METKRDWGRETLSAAEFSSQFETLEIRNKRRVFKEKVGEFKLLIDWAGKDFNLRNWRRSHPHVNQVALIEAVEQSTSEDIADLIIRLLECAE